MSTEFWMQMKDMGRTIAKKRRKLNLNQTELGQRAGVSRKYVSRVENGKNAKLDTLTKLASSVNHDIRFGFARVE